MRSISPAAGTLPHPTATAAPIDLTSYVRDMFNGAIGDHHLPFTSREAAEYVILASLTQRAGRALDTNERFRVTMQVTSEWVMRQIEEQAYVEASALIDARAMVNGTHIVNLLDDVDGYTYARGRTFILRRRAGELCWRIFCGVDVWPRGRNAHVTVRQQLLESVAS